MTSCFTSSIRLARQSAWSAAVLWFVSMCCSSATYAELYFANIWGRSGWVEIMGPEPDRWVLATTDTNENVLYTETSGPLGITGVTVNDGLAISDDFGVSFDQLLGSSIAREPHDLDAGDWAYGMALLDWPGPTEDRDPVVEAYFQLRLAGSSAVVQDTSLAQDAVAAGKWSGVDDYIEFQPSFAYYFANHDVPVRPSDYTGSILPESSSVVLIALGALVGLLGLTRRRMQTLPAGRLW